MLHSHLSDRTVDDDYCTVIIVLNSQVHISVHFAFSASFEKQHVIVSSVESVFVYINLMVR